jgi:AcrR family transcriptional regulator
VSRLPASERRALLISAALRVIASRGVNAASTRAIVAEADMSLASFHYAFRSHEEMMRSLVEWVLEAESSAAFASLVPGADIRDSVRGALQAFFDYVVAEPSHERVMQELLQYCLRTPGLEHLAREQYERYYASTEQLLAAGATASGAQWRIPLSDVARLVVAATDGVTLAYLADGDVAAGERVLDIVSDAIAELALQPVLSMR